MSCNNCTQAKPLPKNLVTISIGTVASAVTGKIFLENTTTGVIESVELDNSADIDITVEELPTGFLEPHSSYNVWVSDEYRDYVDITLADGVTTDECIMLRFEDAGEFTEVTVTI